MKREKVSRLILSTCEIEEGTCCVEGRGWSWVHEKVSSSVRVFPGSTRKIEGERILGLVM